MANDKTRTISPLIKTIGDFMTLLKLVMALVFAGYCFSGLTLIRPDEIGLILRMGRLHGSTPVDQILNPGWVLALPKPFDEVLRIPVKQIQQVKIRELAAVEKKDEADYRTINPLNEGYCVSGDANIFQASILVKYQISDPIKAIFGFSASYNTFSSLVHDLTVAEMTRVAAGFPIDGLLSESKKELSTQVKERVQKQLDRIQTGLSLVSLEIEEIAPPTYLKRDFEEVNSAFINRHNFINDARSLSEEKLPKARGNAGEMVNKARSYQQTVVAEATANAGRFNQLLTAWQNNPEEVKLEMTAKVQKLVIEKMRRMVVVPGGEAAAAGVRLMFDTSTGSSLPVPTNVNPAYDELSDEEEED